MKWGLASVLWVGVPFAWAWEATTPAYLKQYNDNFVFAEQDKTISIHATAAQTCVLKRRGRMSCWGGHLVAEEGFLGYGKNSELGKTNGTTPDKNGVDGDVPIDESTSAEGTDYNQMFVACGCQGGQPECPWVDYPCAWAQRDNYTVSFPGRGTFDIPKELCPNNSTMLKKSDMCRTNVWVEQVALGRDHTCAVLSDGNFNCWGRNEATGRGNTDITGHSLAGIPALMPYIKLGPGASHSNSGAKVKQATANSGSTCVLLEDSTVKCFGHRGMCRLDSPDCSKSGSAFDEWVGNEDDETPDKLSAIDFAAEIGAEWENLPFSASWTAPTVLALSLGGASSSFSTGYNCILHSTDRNALGGKVCTRNNISRPHSCMHTSIPSFRPVNHPPPPRTPSTPSSTHALPPFPQPLNSLRSLHSIQLEGAVLGLQLLRYAGSWFHVLRRKRQPSQFFRYWLSSVRAAERVCGH
jgi:hypothetical protein